MDHSLTGSLSRWFFDKFLAWWDCLTHHFHWRLLISFHGGVLNSLRNILRCLMCIKLFAHGRSCHWYHLESAALTQRHITAILYVNYFACTNQIFLINPVVIDVHHMVLEHAVLLRLVNITASKFISRTSGSTLLIGRVLLTRAGDSLFGFTPLFYLIQTQQVLVCWRTCVH